jgi:hypothetical protein
MKSIIHVGFPKTASTTIQRCLYEQHPNIYYFGEDGDGCESPKEVEVGQSLIFDNNLFFSMSEAENLFKTQRERASNQIFVYSNVDVVRSQDPGVCAERLKHLMPDAEVVFVVRNQLNALKSFYASHGVYLKPAPPSYFGKYVSLNDWMQYCLMFPNSSPISHFRYKSHIIPYIELFGKKRIHIFIFEDFINKKTHFINKLSELLEVDSKEAIQLLENQHERSRHTQRMLQYRKLRTSFLWNHSISNKLPFGKVIKKQLDTFLSQGDTARVVGIERWQDQLREVYAEDNQWLIKNFDLHIETYNYLL